MQTPGFLGTVIVVVLLATAIGTAADPGSGFASAFDFCITRTPGALAHHTAITYTAASVPPGVSRPANPTASASFAPILATWYAFVVASFI